MIYYRDPLLDKICDRIADLDRPAYIKNGALVYVAVNDAYARLFNLSPSDLVGTGRGEYTEVEALLDIEDKERACLVFGEDQRAIHSDPFGRGRFAVELERFTLADAQSFVYVVFNPQTSTRAATEFQGLPREQSAPKTSPGGVLSGDLAEYIIDNMVAGVCVYDRDNRLIYFNRKLEELYTPLIGPLHIGMDLEDVMRQIADDNIRVRPNDAQLHAGNRDAWVAERVAVQQLPYSMNLMPLSDGKWLQCINRRLASGVFVGLRVDVTEMKNQEELLKRHIEEVGLFRELLNRLPVAAFVRGPDQRLYFANQAYADLLGRSQEDIIGLDEIELFGAKGISARDMNRETLLTGKEIEHEQDLTVGGGRVASTIVKTSRVVTQNGRPYVIGTIVDVTPMRQREMQLQDANARAESIRRELEDIMSSIDVGLIVLDRNLNIEFMNEAYRTRVWGTAGADWEGDVVGRSFRELLKNTFDANQSPVNTNFEEYYEKRIAEILSREPYARESLLADGKVLLFSGVPLEDGKSLLCYFDLTELRKRDREILKAHEEADRAYRLALSATDTMPEGLMVLEGHEIVLTNQSLAPLLNIPQEILEPGQTWEASYLATLAQQVDFDAVRTEDSLERFRDAIATRKDLSYDFPLADGRWIHLDMRARDNGQTVIICSDQTEVFRRQEELRRLVSKAEAADRAKSEFLANMSHEIRTPMNGILGMAELLSKSALDTRQKTFTEIIMKSGSALLTIINDILDFSRLDAGQMQLKLAPFDPLDAVEDVATLLASRAAEKDIELIIRRTGDVPAMVNGDAGRFRQIVTNLLGNAVKFTESGHVVTTLVGCPCDDGGVRLDLIVEDTGIGIPADKLDTIFKQFSQVDSSSTRRHEGTGLGLAISERLAKLQGGTISVVSTEGVGSVFTVSLPFQVASVSSRRKPLPVNVEGARVLVIDDNEVNRAILLEQLTEWGFEGVAAPDGETGLAILDAARMHGLPLDLIILDSQMPGLSGADVARRVRADSTHDETAIVFLTSVDIVDTEENLADLKVQAHLMKPARSAILRDTVIEVIRGARIRSGLPQALRPRAVSPVTAVVVPFGQEPTPQPVAPAAPPAPRAMPATAPASTAVQAFTGEVLVAEDNDVNRIVFSQILEASGISYRIVANGAEAVEAWRKARPAIIMMDISMPVMNGLQATSEIRRQEAETGEHVPIIGVTAHALDGDREMCLASGMDDYITKPISPERLEDKIRRWTAPADGSPAESSGS